MEQNKKFYAVGTKTWHKMYGLPKSHLSHLICFFLGITPRVCLKIKRYFLFKFILFLLFKRKPFLLRLFLNFDYLYLSINMYMSLFYSNESYRICLGTLPNRLYESCDHPNCMCCLPNGLEYFWVDSSFFKKSIFSPFAYGKTIKTVSTHTLYSLYQITVSIAT